MSEPWYPVPDPEPNSYWDPEPARCSECGAIIGVRPSGEGWCSKHGLVSPVYPGSQVSENPDEEEE